MFEKIDNKEILKNRIRDEKNNTFPEVILIDTISYCNLRCSMCPHKEMKRTPNIMDFDLYKKIIDEISIKKPDARIWITFFGEGLMLYDLPEKIRYAKEKGLKDVVLNTNGVLFTEEKSKKLIQAGLDYIYVGIDAFKEETYLKFRVGGNLEKVTNGVLNYKKLLKKYGNDHQDIFVQFVEMDENKNELNDFIKFWRENDIKCKIRPMVSWAGKVEAKNLKNEDYRIPCNWGMNTINIADNGKVCLCSVDLNCENIMGDITKNSIEEVWNSSLKEFRENQIMGNWDKLPLFCKNCNDWQSSYAKYIDGNENENNTF
jgi:radical SAM protein with 4Fe4S-binding SPASM domain